MQDIPSLIMASSTLYGVGDAFVSASFPLYRVEDAEVVESNTADVVLDS